MSKKANITVIGFPKILAACQEVAEEYLNNANFLYYQYLPEVDGVRYVASSPAHPLQENAVNFSRVGHDIIIVGVVTAKALKGVNKDSIIPFRAGHKAVIKAFIRAREIADKAAFICPIEEKHNVRFYEELVGLKIDIYYADHLADFRRFCKDAKHRGHSVVVSGSYTFTIAKDYGLTPVFLFSDHDIFRDAYSRAMEAHRYNRSLEEKVAQLDIISQNSEDSVILVDTSGNITFINTVAEQKLKLQHELVAGRPITTLFSFVTRETLSRKKENCEVLGTVDKEPVLVTIHPVLVGPSSVGSVLIAKKVNEIRAMDSRIRQKMRNKGFRAKYTFKDILGDSPVMQECRKQAELYAASEAPVLINGATGTGKELFAQAIHNSSPRRQFGFVAINCATLPVELMESELFGYVKGAFTGASSLGKQGLVDQAHLGTLFFDEVDSLSTSLQAKLLRLLQEKEFIRVGGNEVIPVDIRIIAACNRKQSNDPERNLLRQDLFYRLSTLYLQLPPLSERTADIPLLFKHFLSEYDDELAANLEPLPEPVSTLLSGLDYQGNLRELQSIGARFACLCDKTLSTNQTHVLELLHSCCLTDVLVRENTGQLAGEGSVAQPLDRNAGAFNTRMKLAEKEILSQAKRQYGGSVQTMTKELGLGRTTLWRKLKEHQLD